MTSGIWRLIGIDAWSGCRLAAVRPQTGVGGDPRRLRVEVEVQREAAGEVAVRAEVAGSVLEAVVAAEATSAVLEAVIPDAELWWPRGYGAPALSSLVVTAGPDRLEKRIGFRAVEIDTTPDDDGAPFVVRLNGRDVYVRGANWIPEDTFFSRITRERLAERFRDTTDAGMNLLRVWGGGIYESDDFYDLADENGILVWQDFLLACAAYSEDAELWDEFAAEARDNVTRLAPHASLVVWNGGNENIWGWVDWKWRPRLRGATWGEGYYQELFPGVVAELAPATPYSPGVPTGSAGTCTPNDPAHGTTHIWDVWNQVDYDVYRDYRPRFVSEFGFQGPPAWSTLFSVVHDEPADPYGPLMLVHQKAVDGNGKLERGLGPTSPRPARSTTGTGRRSSTRPARWRSASRTSGRCTPSIRGRSSGSSTTAGRSSRGRRSTPTATGSHCGTPCAPCSPTGSRRSSRTRRVSCSRSTTTTTTSGPGPSRYVA